MKPTISVICYTSKTLSNGEHPIMLRIAKDGKRSMRSLGVSVNAKYWDFKRNQPKSKCPNRDIIEQIILKVKSDISEKVLIKNLNKEEFTSSTILNQEEEQIKAQTVDDFYKELISNLREKGKIGNSYAYFNSYNSLKKYNKGKRLLYTFSHIDTAFLKSYEEWMYSNGNKETTLSFQFRTLRAVFRRAIEGKVVSAEKNPFEIFKISNFNTKTQKRALSKEDIMKIIDSEAEVGSRREFARDIFTFSYFCGGISFVDIASLEKSNILEMRLIYHRQKTNGAINIKLSHRAVDIISKYSGSSNYLFPILDSKRHITPMQKNNRVHKVCSQVNGELKLLAKELGIKADVTTYVARHSFATILKKSGVNIGIISEALGHQDIKTTAIYLSKFDNEQIDEALENLL